MLSQWRNIAVTNNAVTNNDTMGTYPKLCCHFGVLIASYGDDDEDEDEDEDDD